MTWCCVLKVHEHCHFLCMVNTVITTIKTSGLLCNMNKNKVDILIHSVAAVCMLAFIMPMQHEIGITVAIITIRYMWETAQRMMKDSERKGFLYWWNIAKWSEHARLEFLIPSLVAIVAVNVYLIITL